MSPVLAVVLALAFAEAVGLLVFGVLLARSRARVRELEASYARQPVSTATALAGTAVRALATSASRLRSGGLAELFAGSLDDLERWAREDRAGIVRVAAPDGTVTVVFTDIENSTPLNDQLGDRRWLQVLAVHERLVRAAVERHDGHVVKNQGDGFMAVFGDPSPAVAAAVDLQRRISAARALRGVTLRVRIGLHAGRVVSRDGDFYGRNVAVAARIAGLADGGQILASDAVVADLEDVALRDLGAHTLKGIAEPVVVHEIGWSQSDR